jgi:hypothetical protein
VWPIPCPEHAQDGRSCNETANSGGFRSGTKEDLVPTTASSGYTIVRRYTGGVAYEQASYLTIEGDRGIAGMTDPILTDPIDFEAEIRERERTHEPLQPVDTDLTNDAFGI